MKKSLLTAALFFASATASAVPITTLEITGGNFSLNGGPADEFILSDFADMTVGGFDGSPPTQADYSVTSIVYFNFGVLGPVAVFTAPTSNGTDSFAAPSGDITDGIATLELDSWTFGWAGYTFNQGSTSTKGATETCGSNVSLTNCSTPIIVDSYDSTTGEFTASWDAVFIESPWPGGLGSWTISGKMSTSEVPVPASVWLFASGIIGLLGLARRRK